MSVARTGALPDSYKYYTISVDSFDGRLLKGQVNHGSLDQGLVFRCLSEMALILEGMFDKLQYPMKSVDQRNFNKKSPVTQAGEIRSGVQNQGSRDAGRLGEFRLHVKYRFHATWQGDIMDLRDGSTFSFQSFLELMGYFNRRFGHEGGESQYGLGRKMCEVVVRNHEGFVISGDISHPAVEQRRYFKNELDIKEEIEYMLNPLPHDSESGNIITPRTMTVVAGNYGPATFVVRLLFRRNATWQGTVCWKERRCQVSFRSFLEMLLLMQDAVAGSENWIEDADILAAAEMA